MNAEHYPEAAFPVSTIDGFTQHGMTLRDWFAGQALVGIASAIPGPGCAEWDYYSGAAYHIADAMLAQRQKASGQ